MKNKTILIFVAEKFEEIELVVPVDIWRRAGYTVILASISENISVKGQQNLIITADTSIDKVDIDEVDLLFIPGGEGHKNIKNNALCMSIIDKFVEKKKYVVAICAGSTVIAHHLKNKKATSYPALKHLIPNWQDQAVVHDDIFITSQGPGTISILAFRIVELLSSVAEASNLKEKMIYRY